MRAILHVAMLTQALVAAASFGGDSIKPTVDFSDFRVVVTYVSIGELANLESKYGVALDRRDIRQDGHHGFTILKRNRETGALTCEIYLPNRERPREVDDKATLSLGHELLHCMRGEYHR